VRRAARIIRGRNGRASERGSAGSGGAIHCLLTQELAEIAWRNGLDTLSHILEMARLEADQLIKR